ncbi:MAG: hypothetical protein Kow0099_15830 [Candidatus Abyssubacteria bacterium]
MPLHTLEIKDQEILVDHAVVGIVAATAPEGVKASTDLSREAGVLKLTVRWVIEKAPGRFAPLEILRFRLGEFYPHAAFVGGRRYQFSPPESIEPKALKFPYNAYYKFRIICPPAFDAALFSKMPLACWQEHHRAFAVAFPKHVTLGGRTLPLFISAGGAEASVEFCAALLREFQVDRKPFGWFSTRVERREQELEILPGEFEATFALVSADTWTECVSACARHIYSEDSSETRRDLANELETAIRFYDRVWDSRNRTHMHLPLKNVPGFESVEFKHSHITDDLTKLVLYRRLSKRGFSELEARERELAEKLLGGAYLYHVDGSPLWHTTTYYNGDGLEAFTHHGIGFVGFPGGMATVVRRLFEYCSLGESRKFENLGKSGADWLVKTQAEDGSWPAVLEGGGEAYMGCVASTAEAVRALIAAYLYSEREHYRAAAERAMRFVNRQRSFFGCRQYLRDVDPAESDGITAEACIHANLDWHYISRDDSYLEQASKWGWYALQWVRPRQDDIGTSFDGLSRSITPRIDVWGGLLIARAFLRLSRATGRYPWHDQAWQLFHTVADLKERDGGLCETWFLDYPSGLESIHIEPSFSADAFVEFLLDASEEQGANPRLLASRSERLRVTPELSSSEEAIGMVQISRERPEFLLDHAVQLGFAFDGAYDWASRVRQSFYTMCREIGPGRQLLKLFPVIRIMFNRRRVLPPISTVGRTSTIEVTDLKVERASDRAIHRYQTPVHEFRLSVVSVGADPANHAVANLEFHARTVAGDVRLNQTRIDLRGAYEIKSVREKEEVVVTAGQHEYSIRVLDGWVDGILRDGQRLSFDISLCSNWNYFGEYTLRLRVVRRPK